MTQWTHFVMTKWTHFAMTKWTHFVMTKWTHFAMTKWNHFAMTLWLHHGWHPVFTNGLTMDDIQDIRFILCKIWYVCMYGMYKMESMIKQVV